MLPGIFSNPITKKRLSRFKEVKRAHISLWILIILYMVSLGSELICNNTPLYVRFNGKSYFTIFKFYPEDIFTGNNKKTRPDFKKIAAGANFKDKRDNFMIFPLVPFSPYESIDPESIGVDDKVTIFFTPMPMIGTVNIKKDYLIARSASFSFFMGKTDNKIKGLELTEYFHFPEDIRLAVKMRFANIKAQRASYIVKSRDNVKVAVSLSTFFPREKPPETVRLTFREVEPEKNRDDENIRQVILDKDTKKIQTGSDILNSLSDYDRKTVLDLAQKRLSYPVDPITLIIEGKKNIVTFVRPDVSFPFAPVSGHLMGIDGAGRDVLARILYGLRTSLTFGLMLVACSMFFGIIAGSVQGYYGGLVDITSQRLIEIWSALPFLYIMILMGSVYGRSFSLLLFCYGLFNWIGISYYIRAEFLRLRKQPFVESAECMGISSYKIIFKHILPNALVPVITFFPFSLVGAIGALAALDYLGFGLPPPTPSWGELLFQAQQYRWAWWLILYPSLALFIVMLCGVFVGEGIRNAYDPKRYNKIE